MQHYQILILALSIAFTWVDVLKIFPRVKPFNCIKCLTGWTALIIGWYYIGWHAVVYLPLGLLVGSVFSSIRMRYL